jgi:citrate lyase subunit beta/citryl-CoA lyase
MDVGSRSHDAQAVHLTAPATVWKYVLGATQRGDADLVMLDLEDSIPRGDDERLALGRAHVVRALAELDWGARLRYFRPRGAELDPAFDDLRFVMSGAGAALDGVTYPKVEEVEEVRALDAELSRLEGSLGLPVGRVRLSLLIESVRAEEDAFAIARASSRVASLVFGSLDYWSSLGLTGAAYDPLHPALDAARLRIVKAAASVGVPAIAEMTLDYPTSDKSPEEREAALETLRRDAHHARRLGFRGKWCGIPAQCPVVRGAFAPDPALVARALGEARAFAEAERRGLGAVMIHGKMADRASDRANRVVLVAARRAGLVDDATARELGLS